MTDERSEAACPADVLEAIPWYPDGLGEVQRGARRGARGGLRRLPARAGVRAGRAGGGARGGARCGARLGARPRARGGRRRRGVACARRRCRLRGARRPGAGCGAAARPLPLAASIALALAVGALGLAAGSLLRAPELARVPDGCRRRAARGLRPGRASTWCSARMRARVRSRQRSGGSVAPSSEGRARSASIGWRSARVPMRRSRQRPFAPRRTVSRPSQSRSTRSGRILLAALALANAVRVPGRGCRERGVPPVREPVSRRRDARGGGRRGARGRGRAVVRRRSAGRWSRRRHRLAARRAAEAPARGPQRRRGAARASEALGRHACRRTSSSGAGVRIAESYWSPVLCATVARLVGPPGATLAQLVPRVPAGAAAAPHDVYSTAAVTLRAAPPLPAQAGPAPAADSPPMPDPYRLAPVRARPARRRRRVGALRAAPACAWRSSTRRRRSRIGTSPASRWRRSRAGPGRRPRPTAR